MHLGSSSRGQDKNRTWLTAAALAAAATGAACQQPQPAALPLVPVHVGGEAGGDACGGIGQVANLRKAGFLAVRDGPGTRHAERDRLLAGQEVWLCEERRLWRGVVYAPDVRTDCGVATVQPARAAYNGPCRSGWVFGRYVALTAG